MIGGPWTWSMKGVHGPGPYFDGPGPWMGSMDQGSMFCTFPHYYYYYYRGYVFKTKATTFLNQRMHS